MKPSRTRWTRVLALILIAAAGTLAFAQRQRGSGSGRGGTDPDPTSAFRGARTPSRDDRAGVPEWTVDEKFRHDVFTFVRLEYNSRGRGGWRVDFPGADLNLSYRIEQLTSIKADPNALHLSIDDPRLFDYPFTFMIDPRSLYLSREEAETLRKYLLGGGFLMIDDFWGERMWDHLMGELEKVFPDRKPQSLPIEHPIFHYPYPLNVRPQVPSEDSAARTKDMPDPYRTWEDEISWEEPQAADYRAIMDGDRIMVLICWNTDLSDGWEEEGVSQWFFENFSEKSSYPMGINIIFHAMTH